MRPPDRRRYTAVTAAFTPAASATDIVVFAGGAGLSLLNRLELYGTQTTAGCVELSLIRRAVADTGGTSAVGTAVALEQTDTATPLASLIKYTANPTIDTTGSATLWTGFVFIPAPASVYDPTIKVFDFTAMFGAPLPVRKTSEQFVLSLGGTTPSGAANFRAVAVWDEPQH
jgi:hypothetical protein